MAQQQILGTPLSAIYDCFFAKITDDMYMELTQEDTQRFAFDIFRSAIHMFEFPRFNIYDFDAFKGYYNIVLTYEEINIIATYMIEVWIGQQLASIENIRMKYSGSDFKFSSQANHMAKLQALKSEYERLGFHLQRLYKRRMRDEYGVPRSTLDIIMSPTPKPKTKTWREQSIEPVRQSAAGSGLGFDPPTYTWGNLGDTQTGNNCNCECGQVTDEDEDAASHADYHHDVNGYYYKCRRTYVDYDEADFPQKEDAAPDDNTSCSCKEETSTQCKMVWETL